MWQWLGGGAILAVSFYLSVSVSRMEGRRVRQTEGFFLLLCRIRAEIAAYRTPLDRILLLFENPALGECGFLAAARSEGFAGALDLCRDRLLLDEEELRLLDAFGDRIGRGDCVEEVRLCDYTARELEKTMLRQKEEAPRRVRAARALAVTGGLMLLLFLL